MEYRRFGKTEEELSVITLGGMRYKHGNEDPRDEVPGDTIEQASMCVNMALQYGINHIETAYGYKKSEHIYGIVLNDELGLKRNDYKLMTKGAPETADETRALVEKQLSALKTDYVDFYGWHGINTPEKLRFSCAAGGPVEELLKMKEEGIIRHVGFSTHAPLEIIIDAIGTDLFEFVNLHYYYFYQRNLGAIALAEKKDMGVFIISPNDKGGQLFDAPQKLKEITAPWTPVQWNARFCLANPAVHTLSFGINEAKHFEEMEGIFPAGIVSDQESRIIKQEMDTQKLQDHYADYLGYDMQDDPSGINIPEILRLRMMWKCYNMDEFGRYRYNMLQPDHDWFPGKKATAENLDKIDYSVVPEQIPLRELLEETHKKLNKEKE